MRTGRDYNDAKTPDCPAIGPARYGCYGSGNPVGGGAGLRAGCSGRANLGAGGSGRYGGSNGNGHGHRRRRRNEHADAGIVGYRRGDQRGHAGNRSHGSSLTGADPNPASNAGYGKAGDVHRGRRKVSVRANPRGRCCGRCHQWRIRRVRSRFVGSGYPAHYPAAIIDASISTLDLEATRSFLEANGGAITESFQPRGAVNWVISADMPPALLPALSQQPETLHAFVGVLYEKVDNEIGELVVEYAVKKANNPGTGLGGIEAIVEATPEGYANVRRLLARHNLRLTYPDDFGKRHGFQIIPAGLILPISELPGVTYINRPPIAVPAALPESQHRPALPARSAVGVHGALRCAML